jgi:hypothetical protein
LLIGDVIGQSSRIESAFCERAEGDDSGRRVADEVRASAAAGVGDIVGRVGEDKDALAESEKVPDDPNCEQTESMID